MKKYRIKKMALCVLLSSFLVPCPVQLFGQQKKQESKVSADLEELVSPSRLLMQRSKVSSPLQKLDLTLIRGNSYIVVDAIPQNGVAELATDLEKIGMLNTTSYGGLVSGLLPLTSIPALKNVSTLKFISPVYKPLKNSGIATTNGDVAIKTATVRKDKGVDGSGVMIGVLSDSYNNLGTASKGVASGDLPGPGNPDGYNKPVLVLEDLPEGGTDEGRAMAEIIHDVAPGASMAFKTAYNGQADFANGIINLAKAGCNIITDDIIYLAEPFFQDGIIAQAVDQVSKNRRVGYFSAAGNYSRDSYQSSFRSGRKYTVTSIFGDTIGNYMLHDFDQGPKVDVFQKVTFLPFGTLLYSFQWDDPFASVCENCPGAKSDLDIFLTLEKDPSTVVLQSINSNIGGDPVEILSAFNNSPDTIIAYIAIGKWLDTPAPTPNPGLIKYVSFGDNLIDNYYTPSPTCFGHSNSKKGAGVGASAWFYTPAYGTTPPKIDPYSSAGGVPILFNTNGKRLTKPEIRQNPLFVAPDGGNTSFFGFLLNDGDTLPNFFGTSAAAPHAAATAALLTQIADNQVDQKEITRLMAASAIDMDDPYTLTFDKGYDVKTGYGLLQADKAVEMLLKEVGIKTLTSYAECSKNPDSIRIWRVYNPNAFGVNVTWQLYGSDQQGSFLAKQGDNFLTTKTESHLNLLTIKWVDAWSESKKAVAYSTGENCSHTKSALANTADASIPLVITSVYPSPFTSQLTIELYNGNEKNVLVNLYNIHGQLTFSSEVETNDNYSIKTIDASRLPGGVYLMKVWTKEGKLIGTSKIIKE